jgi:hypothetical protein
MSILYQDVQPPKPVTGSLDHGGYLKLAGDIPLPAEGFSALCDDRFSRVFGPIGV